MSRPLSDFAPSLREVPVLQRGPGYPETLSVFEVGGPSDSADRRLVVDRATLEQLLDVARASLTGRVVLHRVGLRVEVLESGGHRWEHVILIGGELRPESPPIFGAGR